MKLHVALCSVVPIAWLILAGIIQAAAGPYSLLDPDYFYLLSSLDLAEFKSLGIFHHPGTPVAMLGAAVMTGHQLLGGFGEGVQADVLKHPEEYLAMLRLWSAILIALGLSVVGAVTLRTTRNPWLAVLLQLSVFIAPLVISESVGRFKPEPVLLFACLMFVAVIVAAVRSPNPGSRGLAITFGLVCGLGLATKFTFASVALVPVLLARGWKQKGVVVGWTLLAFVLFTLPIANRFDDLAMWVLNNLTHTGLYGSGERGVVDAESYLAGVAALAKKNLIFGGVVAIAIAVIAVVLVVGRNRRHAASQNQEFRALCALVISLIVGFALVTKHGSFVDANRYLFCSYSLMGLTLWLSVRTYAGLAFGVPAVRPLALVAVTALVAAAIAPVPRIMDEHMIWLGKIKEWGLDRDSKLAQLEQGAWKDYARIFDVGGVPTALNNLFQASYYSTGHLDALAKAFPTTYFCDAGNCTGGDLKAMHLVTLGHQVVTAEELTARHGDRIVVIHGLTTTIEAVK